MLHSLAFHDRLQFLDHAIQAVPPHARNGFRCRVQENRRGPGYRKGGGAVLARPSVEYHGYNLPVCLTGLFALPVWPPGQTGNVGPP